MTTITVACQECKQTFQTEVDEEGLKFIGLERLQSMARCDPCVAKRDRQRNAYKYAQQKPKQADIQF